MYQQIECNWQTLFDKAWSTPLLKVAAEIGVPDVAIAKACRKAGIPLPRRGHWATVLIDGKGGVGQHYVRQPFTQEPEPGVTAVTDQLAGLVARASSSQD